MNSQKRQLIDEFNYELNSSELNVTYLRQITVSQPQVIYCTAEKTIPKTFLDEMKRTSSTLHQSSLQLSFRACVNKQTISGRNSKTHSSWAGRISPHVIFKLMNLTLNFAV